MPDALHRPLALDIVLIRAFLLALTGSADGPAHWQIFDDTPARDQSLARCWHGSIDIQRLTEAQLAGCGVFVAVNETDGLRRLASSIVRIRSCFCDVDGLPITPVLPPSFWTITARGPNPFWLATGPVNEFSYVQARLARYYGTDKAVKDPSRVMRVPGTWHLKAEPRLVGFRPGSDVTYSFQQILDAHPIEDPPPPDFKKFRLVRPSKAWVETRSKLVRQRASGRSWAEGGRHMALLETLTHARKFHLPDDHVRSIAYEYGSTAGLPDREIEKVYEWVMVSVTPNPDDDPALRTAPVPVPDPPPDSSPDSLPDPIAAVYAEIAALESPTLREQRIKETSKKFDISVSTIKAEVSALRKSSEGPKLVTQNFAIDLSGLPWFGSWKGVFGAKSVPGGWVIDENAIVCTRPLWPAALGQEVSTGEDFVKLRWVDQYGETRERWYSQISLRDRDTIRSIPGACVGASRVNKISDYLADAETVIRDCGHKLTAHLGWVNREWVWTGSAEPSGPSLEYIGDPLPPAGDLTHWRRGLDHLLTLGEAGYPALVCLAASAGAPLVRLAGRRNPVIALASRTSTGKGSSVNYALSIWTDANLLTLPASSTVKGTQDRAMWLPDVALFADELHQLEDDDLHKLLYFLGNGQRRVTSTIHQKAVGGQRRYGVSFVAAEMELLSGRHGGVGTRVIEITAPPLPNAKAAGVLQNAARHHGAAGARLAAILTPEKARLLDDANGAVSRRCSTLHGDDLTALSVVWAGARLLCEALNLDQDWVKLCMEWLIGHHTEARNEHIDRVAAAWDAIMGTVSAGLITEDLQLSLVANEPIAWRNPLDTWDVNPRHPRIVAICRENGGEYQLVSAWADRGLIVRGEDRHLRVRRQVGTELVRVFRQKPKAQE